MSILLTLYLFSALICFTFFIWKKDDWTIDMMDLIMILIPIINTVVVFWGIKIIITDYIDRNEP